MITIEALQLTAEKRLRYASSKLPSETSFMRRPLAAILEV